MPMRVLQLTFLIMMSLLSGRIQAEIVLIVHPSNTVEQLSQREIVDLYMGRTQHFAGGSLVLRLDLPPDSPARKEFYQTLVNRSVAQVNAYWARLLFTGRASPPQVVDDSAAVLEAVRSNANAIGYLDSAEVDDTVKVVGRVF